MPGSIHHLLALKLLMNHKKLVDAHLVQENARILTHVITVDLPNSSERSSYDPT